MRPKRTAHSPRAARRWRQLLYSGFTAPDGRELLILERLPRVGIDGSELEFGLFIDALASLNATWATALPAVAASWVQDWLDSTHMAWRRARSGAWGRKMQDASVILDQAWPALEQLADMSSELATLPLESTHQDPNFENCGWRKDGTLVFSICRLRRASLHFTISAPFSAA